MFRVEKSIKKYKILFSPSKKVIAVLVDDSETLISSYLSAAVIVIYLCQHSYSQLWDSVQCSFEYSFRSFSIWAPFP